MDVDFVCGFTNTFYKAGLFGFRFCSSAFICIHIVILSALFALNGFTAVLIFVCVYLIIIEVSVRSYGLVREIAQKDCPKTQ